MCLFPDTLIKVILVAESSLQLHAYKKITGSRRCPENKELEMLFSEVVLN
uniref:Uncharacterized protein n=1 Tax=Anguilla anguilla TaxID=7936 RepID=A0A0E9TCP3_ANGAN